MHFEASRFVGESVNKPHGKRKLGRGCLAAGYDSEESPGKCCGYACANCQFLGHGVFAATLAANEVLGGRLGIARDRAKFAAAWYVPRY